MTDLELTENAIWEMLALVAATDGHKRGAADMQAWLIVARKQNWRPAEAHEAVVEMAARHAGGFSGSSMVLPGQVGVVIHERRSQPQRFAEQQAELEAARAERGPDATAAVRLAAIAEFVEHMTRKRPMPTAQEDPIVAKRRAGFAGVDWAAIGACGVCDEHGIRLDARDVVCEHPQRNPGCDPQDGGVASGAHTPTAQEDDDHAT